MFRWLERLLWCDLGARADTPLAICGAIIKMKGKADGQ